MQKLEILSSSLIARRTTGSNGYEYFAIRVLARPSNPNFADRETLTDEFIEQVCSDCPLYVSGVNFDNNMGIFCSPGEVLSDGNMESYVVANPSPRSLGALVNALCQVASVNGRME